MFKLSIHKKKKTFLVLSLIIEKDRNIINYKNILITGVVGFIGFHLAKKLIKSNHNIYGLDNLNDYYDVSLKDRLNQISNNENFKFEKIDISDRQLLEDFFSNNKIDMVVKLAAQPGVRYSIENPYAYMNSNLVGF